MIAVVSHTQAETSPFSIAAKPDARETHDPGPSPVAR
jgi:hypothetical protein